MVSPQTPNKKTMITNDKDTVEGYFNLKTFRHNIMLTFFYSNISQFAGKFQGIIDEGMYKTTIKNIHKLSWKLQFFKSADVLMSDDGCGVS